MIAHKTLIGFAEYVSLPEFGIAMLRAKTDTGARTSALHVENIEHIAKRRVRFDVVLGRRDGGRRVSVEARVSRRSTVRSSNGQPEERFFVRTRLVLGPVEKDIEISLASRGGMTYRMLLGRLALEDDFIVDPGRRYVATHRVRKKQVAKKKKKKAKKKVVS